MRTSQTSVTSSNTSSGDNINPATSTTPPTSANAQSSTWTIEEADNVAIENQKKFDRSIARIVELAMDADISYRTKEGVEKEGQATAGGEGGEEGNREGDHVLRNKLDRAYSMMCNYFNEGESCLLYLPGVFKVLLRACLSHDQVDRALDVYNKSLKCGVVLSDVEFQRLCKALEERKEH